MATLEKIRQKGVLLTVIIGGALLAFIIGGIDFKSFNRSSREVVAEVNGNEIKIADYEKRIDEMTSFYKVEMGQTNLPEEYVEQIRNSVWDTWLNEQLVGAQCEKLGIVVTDEELADALCGNNIHPIITSVRMFYNPQTGKFDKSYLMQFLNNMDKDDTGEAKKYWSFIERMVKNNMLEQKYQVLLANAVSVNNIDIKYSFEGRNNTTDIAFVVQPYQTLSDSLFKVSDQAIKERYEKKKSTYKQEESADILAVSFDIVPSQRDFEEVKTWIEKLQPEFATSDDFVAIANQNSDTPNKDIALSRNYIDPDLRDFAFSGNIGQLFGPKFVNGAYKMARIIQKGIIASDSAKVRHILVQEATEAKTQQVVDSLMGVLKAGANFADVAKQNSKAGTGSNGGDLGWIKDGDLDKNFSKSAINATVNDLFTVKVGSAIHIVQVTEKTKPVEKVKLATIIREVVPSSSTYGSIYNKASQFLAKSSNLKKFEANAKPEQGIFVRNYNVKKQDPRIANFKDSRQIIRWAFNQKEGDVADKVFECGDQFVVVALKSLNEEGIKPFEKVKTEVKAELIKEQKADKIAASFQAKIAQGLTIEQLGLPVQAAQGVSFDSQFVPGMGREPMVLGNLLSIVKTQKPRVIKGDNGVYVVKSTVVAPKVPFNKEQEIRIINSRMFYQPTVIEALKKASEIKDNRLNFY